MATQPVDIGALDSQISGLDDEAQSLQDKLESNPSYYGSGAAPVLSDISTQLQLKKIQDQQSALMAKRVAAQWYGAKTGTDATTTTPAPTHPGIISTAIDALQQPLYAEVGAAKWLTGKADPNQSILDTINENRTKAHEGFGGLLRQFNVPLLASMPAGLALDIGLDPLNAIIGWGGAGEAGLIGKALEGYKETKSMEGVSKALADSFFGGFSGLWSRLVPKSIPRAAEASAAFNKVMAIDGAKLVEAVKDGSVDAKDTYSLWQNVYAKARAASLDIPGAINDASKMGGSWLGDISNKIYAKSSAAKNAWEAIHPIEKDLEAIQNNYTIFNLAKDITNKLPGGDKVADFLKVNFGLDNAGYATMSRMKDKVYNKMDKYGLLVKHSIDPVSGKIVTNPTAAIAMMRSFNKDYEELLRAHPEIAPELEAAFKDDVAVQKSGWITKNLSEMTPEEYAQGTQSDKNFIDYLRSYDVNNTDEINKLANLEHPAAAMDDAGTGILKLKAINYADQVAKKDLKFIDLSQAYNPEGGAVELVKMFPWMASNKQGAAFLNSYERLNSMWKTLRVSSWNPASMLYAKVGNHVMAHMAGIDVTAGSYFKALKDAKNFMTGKDPEAIKKFFLDSPEIQKFAEDFPSTFAKTFGFSPSAINVADIFNDVEKMVKTDIKDASLQDRIRNKVIERVNDAVGAGSAERKAIQRQFSRTELARAVAEGTPTAKIEPGLLAMLKESGLGTDLVSYEFSGTNLSTWRNELEASVKDGGINGQVSKFIIAAMDSRKGYELIDQSHRLGNFVHLTRDGVTHQELIKLARLGSKKKDVSTGEELKDMVAKSFDVGGVRHYALTPRAAMDYSNEIYMNYAAMPAAVKILRGLPLIGGPFASFSYGMMLKTAKTMVYNPTAFNKISFLMNEVQGDKSPMEKLGLSDPIYQYFNRPGMVSLSAIPFFKNYPIYWNLAQYAPYYNLQMFSPIERDYGKGPLGWLAAGIDRSPFFKTPEMQTLMDYIILPALIGGTDPQNQFGTPLYPSDATALQKVGYGARSYAESFAPGYAALAGVPIATLYPKLLNYLPSYYGRTQGFGALGQSPVGAAGKEPALQRLGRGLLGMSGIGLHPMDFNYLTANLQKELQAARAEEQSQQSQ